MPPPREWSTLAWTPDPESERGGSDAHEFLAESSADLADARQKPLVTPAAATVTASVVATTAAPRLTLGALDAISLTAAIAQLVQMGVQSVRALRKAIPEYGRFWDDFESQLKNEFDVPWESLVSNCYLQPDFITWAVEYIAGDIHGRQAMEAHFESFIEPPAGASLDKAGIVARVNEAARRAANTAASSDRKAALANRQLVIAAVLEAINGLTDEVQKVHVDLRAMRHSVGADLKEILERLPAERDNNVGRAEEQETAPRVTLDAHQVEAMLEKAADLFLERQREAQGQAAEAAATERGAPRPAGPTLGPTPAPVLPTTPGIEALSQQEHLERLRETNEPAARELERIVRDGGVLSLATALRTDQIPHEVETLVAAARIVSGSGFYSEAEQAFLRAGELDLDAPAKARQFVRAARVADVLGDSERCQRHLDRAREIDPGNSTLAIAEARRCRDGASALQRVEDVEPIDDEERALLHQVRAQARLDLDDEEGARREYQLAREASETNIAVREFGAILVLHESQQRVAAGQEPDIGALRDAGELFESMVNDLLRENRPIEAAALTARAAEAFMVGRQFERADAVLTRLPAPDLLPEEVVDAVAQAATICQRPDVVLRFVGADADAPLAVLLRAEAQAQLPGAENATVAQAVSVLESLLSGQDDALAKRAAFSLLDVAVRRKDVPWNAAAARLIAADQPRTEAGMRAERHLLLEEYDQAETALLPAATTATTQRRLRDYAALAGDWAKAADRSRQLVRDYNLAADRFTLGQALKEIGDLEGAAGEFLKLARDSSVEEHLRDAAFGSVLEIVGANRDYGATLELSSEWHEALPESSNAVWNILFSLARLSQHDEAYKLAEDARPDPSTPERATLLAEIYYRAAPGRDSVTTIVALSDRYERKIEALEALTVGAALGIDGVEIGEPLASRVADTIQHFEERFPDSQTIRSFPAPQSAEELEELLKEVAGDRPALQAQMAEAVRDGAAPVNAFAAVGPSHVAATWRELIIWPLGFAMERQDESDREAARRAVGGAAVFDPSSLVVLSQLSAITDRLLGALPGSAIANETLDDVDGDTQPTGRRVARSEHLPDGSVVLREITAEEEAHAAKQAAEAVARAKTLQVLPPIGDGVSDEIRHFYEDDDNRPEFRVLAATLALAQRLRRPIHSDDRWTREFARFNGIEAFGTLALLDVLEGRDVIASAERQAARLELTERGAWGIALDRDELIAAGRSVSFELSRKLIGAFHDRAAWRAQVADRFQAFGAFLGTVFEEEPQTFRLWLHRVLDAAHAAAPHMHRSWFAEVLLMMCWGLGDEDPKISDACFHELVAEIKDLPPWLSTLDYDIVMGAINQLLMVVSGQSEKDRFLFFCRVIRHLRTIDAVRAIKIFVV